MNTPLKIKAVDIESLQKITTNLYETICLITKRASQISAQQKLDMNREFLSYGSPEREGDSIINEQQLAVAKKYEQISQPSLLAIEELYQEKLYYKYASKSED